MKNNNTKHSSGLTLVPTEKFSKVFTVSDIAKKGTKNWRIISPFDSFPKGLGLKPILLRKGAKRRYVSRLCVVKGYMIKRHTIIGIIQGENYSLDEVRENVKKAGETQAVYRMQHFIPGTLTPADSNFIMHNKNKFLDSLGHSTYGKPQCNVECLSGCWINEGKEEDRVLLFKAKRNIREQERLCFDYNPFWIKMSSNQLKI